LRLGGSFRAGWWNSVVDPESAILLAELAGLRPLSDLFRIADDEGVSALVDAYRGDRQTLMVLSLTLLFRAILVAELCTFGKQFVAALDARHCQYISP
jgi:hypothetical protein